MSGCLAPGPPSSPLDPRWSASPRMGDTRLTVSLVRRRCPMSHVVARSEVPLPVSVSDRAREFLAAPPARQGDLPALEDTEGWLRHVVRANEGLLERLGQRQLPLSVEEREIGGVPTYVMWAPDVAATTDTPIYLDIHGGALIMGGGECCRRMAGVSAM